MSRPEHGVPSRGGEPRLIGGRVAYPCPCELLRKLEAGLARLRGEALGGSTYDLVKRMGAEGGGLDRVEEAVLDRILAACPQDKLEKLPALVTDVMDRGGEVRIELCWPEEGPADVIVEPVDEGRSISILVLAQDQCCHDGDMPPFPVPDPVPSPRL